ncbi:arylsulfatase A-like enzyme [Maribacter vaceletii]|uniref:Arylsulfatase A-like enzyme n=1 Tax=Maribacter vaceletii TaxID=1206816 RepID=A0A495E5T4_9FLAO|nr:arylsulfatase [Maribacter vaceletii]RKR12156.1 arylsulfatase A-like enzyme [Maribacter vaceletii]
MMVKRILFALLAIQFFSCKEAKKEIAVTENGEVKKTPNIIYILADDLGYGDLSSYGQKKFNTPNIDKMAANGIKFTNHYSGAAVCAPARSSLMTGQHTGHTPIRGNKEAKGGGQTPLPVNAITIAEMLKSAGYVTGAFGKWGLGYTATEGDPNAQGFDEFYGYNDQKMAHRYYPPFLWRNQEKDSLKGNDWTNTVTYAPDVIQEETMSFLENNKDKPFFAYIPLVLPHAELISPKDSILKKYEGKFIEKPHLVTSDKYTSDYGPDMEYFKYCPQMTPNAVYASMVDRMDVYVGQIIDKVNDLGIADNTIIMFASDNGPHGEGGADVEFFESSGGLRGKKRDLYEGGIRSPFIALWPGKIKKGSISEHISAFWDVMPTVAEIAGITSNLETDGISFLPTLLDTKNQKKHKYLYWEFGIRGGRQAIRIGNWKGVVYDALKGENGTLELYNLEEDGKEEKNIAKIHPEIVKEMKELLVSVRTESKIFPL